MRLALVTLVLLGAVAAPAPRRATAAALLSELGASTGGPWRGHDTALAARLRTETRLLRPRAPVAGARWSGRCARPATRCAVAAGRTGRHARARAPRGRSWLPRHGLRRGPERARRALAADVRTTSRAATRGRCRPTRSRARAPAARRGRRAARRRVLVGRRAAPGVLTAVDRPRVAAALARPHAPTAAQHARATSPSAAGRWSPTPPSSSSARAWRRC